ncbi:MAG: hypothetical protein OHK0022_32740 [Roseiflexaceae bacterium]
MSQRTMLMLATGLTAFVLVVVGALASGQFAPAATPAIGRDQAAAADPNAGAQTLPEQPDPRAAPTEQAQQPAQPTTSGYPVTPEQAAQAALAVLPGAQLLAPAELVDAQGIAAYEVRLDQGTLYVAATSGTVLNAPVAGGRGEDERGEHEGREHHGHGGLERSGGEEGGDDD